GEVAPRRGPSEGGQLGRCDRRAARHRRRRTGLTDRDNHVAAFAAGFRESVCCSDLFEGKRPVDHGAGFAGFGKLPEEIEITGLRTRNAAEELLVAVRQEAPEEGGRVGPALNEGAARLEGAQGAGKTALADGVEDDVVDGSCLRIILTLVIDNSVGPERTD